MVELKKKKFTTNYGIVHYIVKIFKKIKALKYLNIFDITKNLLFPFIVSYSRVNWMHMEDFLIQNTSRWLFYTKKSIFNMWMV
jgi:hypothetical protein